VENSAGGYRSAVFKLMIFNRAELSAISHQLSAFTAIGWLTADS
jgi:hypothetical protein